MTASRLREPGPGFLAACSPCSGGEPRLEHPEKRWTGTGGQMSNAGLGRSGSGGGPIVRGLFHVWLVLRKPLIEK